MATSGSIVVDWGDGTRQNYNLSSNDGRTLKHDYEDIYGATTSFPWEETFKS
ncbi:hypothetical protein [Chryseosolibacter indicus]|uniref:Uncharacterized protein n=1 Tax=Chryseosolibacter indicus TaxID=2782351 RepID=A0ABS5VSX8_9BACT|nr:hypothetical protein [Chryseosolibacter indicus]MBT1704529.1 hypothetical protein [Chryseosolibacter indicus]